MLLLLGLPTFVTADTQHPLAPPDFSSPRATLNTFLTTGDRALSFVSGDHWNNPSRESSDRLKALMVDMLISWKEYPHIDVNERAEELLDLLAQQAEGRIHLAHACVDCDMISIILTTQEPGASLARRMRELERCPGV